MARPRVSSLLSNAILTRLVRGTERTMPTGPKTHPQKTNEMKLNEGEKGASYGIS